MSGLLRTFSFALLAYGLANASAVTLRVPEHFATIQSALDSTQAWDTVLVAPGVYHEFLTGPDHSFVLTGEFPPDSGAALQTLLDPVPLPDADTPSTVVVSQDTAVFRNLAFFNRAGLRQQDAPTRSGGIETEADLLRVENCRFDSVSSAIEGGLNLAIAGCAFAGCVGPCIQPDPGGRQVTTNCSFESSAYTLAFVFNNSRVENCDFLCNLLEAHLLVVQGSNIRISGCRFGPCEGGFWVMDIYPIDNIVIENCSFEGLDRYYSILAIGANCNIIGDSPVTIRGNVFRDNHPVGPASGVLSMTLQCASQSAGFLGIVEDNDFFDCSSNVLTPGIHVLNSSVEIRHNLFDGLLPTTLADIFAEGRPTDSVFAQRNSLLPPGLAASRTNIYFDARYNWWGDSTGPFNAGENPDGQGSEVDNGILFIPWLLQHPDSGDTSNVPIDERVFQSPTSFILSAFPNPFNGSTTLSYSLNTPTDVSLVVYNTLGQEVQRSTLGYRAAGAHTHALELAQPSGVYFAKLSVGAGQASMKLLLMR